ncbi:peptidoglycan DD-metalloendopeptidase family protein [Halomonas alkalicola]|uniref:Peptidoglycan DD-metalloendopeptidase family protein n=1 Tax=Halomonas alkalicola TaxID=1930622 RepID=A0ABY9H8K2_9GAMM|nr:peptidoglycan DD-metalloendopeptidase family protein [Halomonas alkalicola]WLI74441.1 peptidoglycan DD-metalloendopeptidase family protein [Halomonas alkalicola]
MLRILHSLPRTHKLLLLPVATMVTVLGAQKIVTTYQDVQREYRTLDTVIVPLEVDARPVLPTLSFERSPVGDAIEMASQALDATRHQLPLAKLVDGEALDLDLINTASASADGGLPLALTRPAQSGASDASQAQSKLDQGAVHMAVVVGTIGSGMLDHDGALMADATSYEPVSDEELGLFDDGPVILEKEIAATEPFVPEWQTYTVKQGDTFAVMAQNHLGLGYSEVLRLLDELPDKNALTRWRAGNSFEYQLDEEGKLLALRMMRNARTGFMVERDDAGFEVATIERTGEASQRLFAGTVSGSFARSAQATGLSSAEISELTRVLGQRLDFRRDTRRGDRFQVLVESDVIDGSSFDPRVLAVQYEGERFDMTLVRNGADSKFYTPDGESLDPAFNRYPFEGSYRLSSGFNPNRRHPVTGRVSPHRGTDFAMPIGTPIIAPADGRVEKVANHPVAGRYVVIRHDNGYQTRYLHLSRPLVSRGDRVTMGERIALSGNTGRSTGPHLHYEVLVNNTQVNAMTVELPENKSLTGEQLVAFKRQAEPLLAALQSGETGAVVASRRDSGDDEG